MVAYTRDQSTVSGPVTRDLRMRRFVPGFGWGELSTVAVFPSDCGSNCGRTSRIGMSTRGAGDPRLLFENPPGGFWTVSTDTAIASPAGVQWPIATADAVAAHTFAPAMATLPDGGRCLVTGTAAASGLPGGRTYQSPRLTLFRGAGKTTISLPSSNSPHLANTVTTTPDGVIHVVSLRTANDSPSTVVGDLRYFRIDGVTVTGPIVIDDNGGEGNIAARDQIALGADATGRLYLAFSGAGRELKLLTLPPSADLSAGQRPWETLATLPGYFRAIDLAVRPDGGVLVSYFKRTPDAVGVYTNVEPKTGKLNASFASIPVYPRPPLVTEEARSTACAFDVRGLPRLAFAFEGDFLVATSRRANLSGDPFAVTNIPGFVYSPQVDMACSGTSILIAVLDRGGTGKALWLVEGRADPDSFSATNYAQIATPGLAPSALGGGVALALDGAGFGTIGAGLVSPGMPGSPDTVYVARDANGLDQDGDGVPLVYENAFGMNAYAPDAELMPIALARKFDAGVEGEIVLSAFQHRFPSVPRTMLSNGASFFHGQFLYFFSISDDLQAFTSYSTVTPLPGLIPSISPLGDLSPGVASQLIGLRADATYRAAHPKSFFALRVRRFR